MQEFLTSFSKDLDTLRRTCGSIWYRDIKSQITNVEQIIAKKPTSVDLKVVLVPFFMAMEYPQVFQLVVFDALINVCKKLKVPAQVFLKMIEVLDKAIPNKLDASVEKMAELGLAIFQNHNAQYTIHGIYLRNLLKKLFKLFTVTDVQSQQAKIRESIKAIIEKMFKSYGQLVPLKRSSNMATLAQNIVYTLSTNTAHIRKFLKPIINTGDYSVTIYDADFFVLFSIISENIEARFDIMSARNSLVLLIYCFDQQSDFYKSTTFKYLLQNQIHVAFLSMFLRGGIEHLFSTGSILKSVWQRFSDFYKDGLFEILTKGLGTTIKSPDPEIVTRSLKVYREMATIPQFFVDLFVNYDCDETGQYSNVFEDSVGKIISLSYPDMVPTKAQLDALEIVVEILQAMWAYFSNFEVSADRAEAPQDFLEAKKTKAKFDIGLEVFKKSPKKGLAFFEQEGFINNTPQSIANFLYSTPSLDPVSVGEVLGTKGNDEVLSQYMTNFDFKGVSFEEAFRTFLQKFTIPGEAQMIDRFMEQFGTKYYNDNTQMFSCADTVYVLSFSALMLHTDAHNHNIKKHMTLPEFIANNKGIDNGKDLPINFLTDLYKGITSKEIFLNPTSAPSLSLLTLEQRSQLYNSQCDQTIEAAKARSLLVNHSFHRSESPLFIGPMFQSIWGGALGTLTMTLQQSNDPAVYNLCLKGLTIAVHIASHCFVETALDTLVDSFSKFTNLRKNLTEVQMKNIQCTNALLRIAIEDKNFLRGAWEIVLSEISALDRKKDELPVIDASLIDELFMATDTLDRESIADFLRSLVAVSKQELAEKEPRKFSLQQLAVVAHFNMKRPRFIWVAIWGIIGEHLSTVGSSSNENMADITIDILRQLAIKFLAEEELSQFHFQEHFMKPFQEIFEHQKKPGPKRLVIDCISMLVHEHNDRLRSGWATVINIVMKAATEKGEVVDAAKDLLRDIINNRLMALKDFYSNLAAAIAAYTTIIPDEIMGMFKALFSVVTQSNQWQIILNVVTSLSKPAPKLCIQLLAELLSCPDQKTAYRAAGYPLLLDIEEAELEKIIGTEKTDAKAELLVKAIITGKPIAAKATELLGQHNQELADAVAGKTDDFAAVASFCADTLLLLDKFLIKRPAARSLVRTYLLKNSIPASKPKIAVETLELFKEDDAFANSAVDAIQYALAANNKDFRLFADNSKALFDELSTNANKEVSSMVAEIIKRQEKRA